VYSSWFTYSFSKRKVIKISFDTSGDLGLILSHIYSDILTYLLTYLLTPFSRYLFQKLTGFQLLKNFPEFYWTRLFITAFTSARHLSLPWVRSIQSIPTHPISWRSILLLSSHQCLGLASGLLISGFPTKTLFTRLLSSIHATCPAHLVLLDIITRKFLV